MLKTPRFWYSNSLLAKIISWTLFPITFLYYIGFILDKKLTKKKSFQNKIISIGGVNIGGSGKTPITTALVKLLKKHGINPFIVTRGYHSCNTSSKILSKNDLNTPNFVQLYGDEASLLTRFADIIIGPKKIESLQLAENKNPAMPVLLDDGHQSHAIMCDIKIIVIDSLQGIGNGYIFPSGPLRQRFTTGMQEADIVIIVKHSESDLFFHSKEFKYIESKKKYFLCSIKNNISNNNNLYPFCGIGFPWKFFDDLKKSGNNILKTKIFPDHHYYSEKELDELVRDAEKLKAKLTTTEKDIVKIPKKYYNSIQVAQLEIVWEKFDESFFEKIY